MWRGRLGRIVSVFRKGVVSGSLERGGKVGRTAHSGIPVMVWELDAGRARKRRMREFIIVGNFGCAEELTTTTGNSTNERAENVIHLSRR